MKCPTCGAWSSVLDTRDGPNESVKRRRECANGHRFFSFEVTATFIHPTHAKRARYGVQIKRARWARDAAICKDPRTSAEIALDYGITDSAVRYIWKMRRRAKP